jgi:hypothetical protein
VIKQFKFGNRLLLQFHGQVWLWRTIESTSTTVTPYSVMRNSTSTTSASSQSIELPAYPPATRSRLETSLHQISNPSEQGLAVSNAAAQTPPSLQAATTNPTTRTTLLPRLRSWWSLNVHVPLPHDADFRDFLGLCSHPFTALKSHTHFQPWNVLSWHSLARL